MINVMIYLLKTMNLAQSVTFPQGKVLPGRDMVSTPWVPNSTTWAGNVSPEEIAALNLGGLFLRKFWLDNQQTPWGSKNGIYLNE
jgi:hypothetical protein